MLQKLISIGRIPGGDDVACFSPFFTSAYRSSGFRFQRFDGAIPLPRRAVVSRGMREAREWNGARLYKQLVFFEKKSK